MFEAWTKSSSGSSESFQNLQSLRKSLKETFDSLEVTEIELETLKRQASTHSQNVASIISKLEDKVKKEKEILEEYVASMKKVCPYSDYLLELFFGTEFLEEEWRTISDPRQRDH